MNYDHLNEIRGSYLEHYGVKGMEWGKKKKRFAAPSSYSKSDASKNLLSGATTNVASDLYKKANQMLANRQTSSNLVKGATSGVVNKAASDAPQSVKDAIAKARFKTTAKNTTRGVVSGASSSTAKKISNAVNTANKQKVSSLSSSVTQKGKDAVRKLLLKKSSKS